MKKVKNRTSLCLIPEDHRQLATLSGHLDENFRTIEKQLNITIANRGCTFELTGPHAALEHASRILQGLYHLCQTKQTLTHEDVLLTMKETQQAAEPALKANQPDDFKKTHIRVGDVSIQARTPNQAQYIQAIEHHEITFGIGPSGTGKTFLAVAAAARALLENQISRLVLVRPAVEAGEKLGFLPGTLVDKIDPYLRPLYDALYQLLGAEQVHKLIEKNVIEVAPLAYMRGRTLNNAFAILDESQNTTPEQMKMFLTRIGFGTRVIVNGDITQTDLPRHQASGLRHAIAMLQPIEQIHFTFFKARDVVRHPLVQKIIEAYEHTEDNAETLSEGES